MKKSILDTCKLGYDPKKYWHERTNDNLIEDSVSYLRDAVSTDGTKEIFAKILPYLPDGAHDFVDIGCGYGIWVDAIKSDPNFGSYLGIDLVMDRIEEARRLHPSVEFMRGDVTCLDRSKKKVNVVLFNNVLQHLSLKQKENAVKYAKSCLSKNGVIIMREGRFIDASLKKCEEYYGGDKCASHMVPTPLPLLRRWIAPRKLEIVGDCLFVARRKQCQ